MDWVEFGLAALLVAVFLVLPRLRRVAWKGGICMASLGMLPVLLRVALLGKHSVPAPRVADDFSYWLLGDTLAHGRLANPMHPMHRFFEGVFVLQEPTYSSIYPLGQGLVLAAGKVLLGHPWAGVVVSVGLLCALIYWMLRAWTSPGWALVGGLLAVAQLGPVSPWMNTYWGGAVSGIAGCLVFGGLPRRNGWLVGLGLGLQLLTRPYEFVVLLVAAMLWMKPDRRWLVILPFAGLMLAQNKAVTGSWTTLPYQLSQKQYGVPATFLFQPMPVATRPLSVEQRLDYEAQAAAHGRGFDFWERIWMYRFFLAAPLWLALPWSRPPWRVWASMGLFLAAGALYPFFYPHYVAALACLFVLVAVKGLERMREEGSVLVLVLGAGLFLFDYGTEFFGARERPDELEAMLEASPGKQLVLVRYGPQHAGGEWIRNEANIDGAKVVWALDLGDTEDQKLLDYYGDRQVWLLEADVHPVRLTRGFVIER